MRYRRDGRRVKGGWVGYLKIMLGDIKNIARQCEILLKWKVLRGAFVIIVVGLICNVTRYSLREYYRF